MEFVTDINENQQKTITGFKIMISIPDEVVAKHEAEETAIRLTCVLVASSGTDSTAHLTGSTEITSAPRHRISRNYRMGYQIRNNAIVNVDPKLFGDILTLKPEITQKMQHIADALKASKAKEYASVIKSLVLACNEEPTGDFAKFKALRNALSHNKAPLNDKTVAGLKDFGPDYFTLTADGIFDGMSASNRRKLKTQAHKFLTHVHQSLKDELNQSYEDMSKDD